MRYYKFQKKIKHFIANSKESNQKRLSFYVKNNICYSIILSSLIIFISISCGNSRNNNKKDSIDTNNNMYYRSMEKGLKQLFNETYNLTSDKYWDIHYKKRLIEAKWLYYESNYTMNKVRCDEKISLDTNICFIENLLIDTTQIGDTLEIYVTSYLPNYFYCIPCNGQERNIFGFYPNIDTVVYRRATGFNNTRKLEIEDSICTGMEMFGVYTRSKQKKMFKEFIIKNQNKINSFLKEQAKKRGYIK